MLEVEKAKNFALFLAIAAVLAPRLWFKKMQDLPSHGKISVLLCILTNTIYFFTLDIPEPNFRLTNLWTPEELNALREMVKGRER